MPKKLMNALTALTVKTAQPGRHNDGGGLQLFVKPSGARSWLFRATIQGKVRDIGLGPAGGANAVSLKAARDRAADKRREIESGVVPISDLQKRKQQEKAAEIAAKIGITFREAANQHIELHQSSWKNDKHRAQWRSTLVSYAFPVLGNLPVADIENSHVLAVLEPLWQEKTETANRLRGRIETILDACKIKGLRSGENPARWRGHLDQVLPAPSKAKADRRRRLDIGENHAALPYGRIGEFMAALANRDAVAAMALEFLILCASRTGEVLGATWGEINFDLRLWVNPPKRMKGGIEHAVPLSDRAVEILREAQKLASGDPLAPVFLSASGESLSNMAMAMLLRRMHKSELAEGRRGWVDPTQSHHLVTVHGFRSTFRDWASETTHYPHELCEMALAHTIGNKAEAAYRRGKMIEKRRDMMQEWADYCSTLINRPEGSEPETLPSPIGGSGF